ncbi:hypothetical protein [uncultured Mediterranean phage uvMED]|nr:hypothetical protein [uncultured Mediterranean phage uvMED]
MNEVLKIVAHEGQSGSYTLYWWESEGAPVIFFDEFFSNTFELNNNLGFETVTPQYHYANFYAATYGEVSGTVIFNSDAEWSYEEYFFYVISAGSFWTPTHQGLSVQMNSISNDGTHQGSNTSESIAFYPSGGDNNAGYEWYFTYPAGILQNHKIMPSIRWVTGSDYNAANDSHDFKLVSKDDFDYLPRGKSYFEVSSQNPLSIGVLGVPEDGYFKNVVAKRFLSKVFNYNSYNDYSGFTTSEVNVMNPYLEVGGLRLSYPIAAAESGYTDKYWHYVNNDFLHKYMGCDVTDNEFNSDLTVINGEYINSNLGYGVVGNQKHVDAYKLRSNYDYYEALNMGGDMVYNPYEFQPDSSMGTYWFQQQFSLENYLYSSVYNRLANHLYAPTVMNIDCFTDESLGKPLSFKLTLTCRNSSAPSNSLNALNSSYIDGTWDTTSPFQGEHGNAAVSFAQVPSTLTSGGLYALYGVTTGQWYRVYGANIPTTFEGQTTSITIEDGNLRFKKAGDNGGRPIMTCVLRLYNSTSYRYYFKNSKKTTYNNTNNHTYSIKIYDGLIANDEFLIHFNKRDLGSDASLAGLNNTNNARIHRENFDLFSDFVTPVQGRGFVSNNTSTYRIVVEGYTDTTDLFFDFIKFSPNIIGFTEESKEYIARRFTPPYSDDGDIFPSAVNSNLKFKLDSGLPKSKKTEDGSLYRKSNSSLFRVRAATTYPEWSSYYAQGACNDPSNTRWLTFSYPNGGINVTTPTLFLNDWYLNTIMSNTIMGSVSFENQENGSSTVPNVFAYEDGTWDNQDLEDSNNLLSGGVIDVSDVPFDHFRLQFTCVITVDDGSGGQATNLAGEEITISLVNQNGTVIKNYYNVDITFSRTLNTLSYNNPNAGTNLWLDSSANNAESGFGLELPVALDGTDMDGNTIQPAITEMSLKIGLPNHVSGDTDNYRICIHPKYLWFQPLMYFDDIISGQLSPWQQWEMPVAAYHNSFQNGVGTNSIVLTQQRKVGTIRTLSDRPETYFEFSPIDYINKNEWGFFLDNESFEVEGKIDSMATRRLSLFADTYSYRESGYTKANLYINKIEFGTNEYSFVTRKDEVSGGSKMRMYWNPIRNEYHQGGITKAPSFTINIPEFTSSTGISSTEDIIGTTPQITVWIDSYIVTPGATLMDNLIVQSGSNHHVIPDGTTGQYVIDDLVIDSEDLLFKIGTWNNSSGGSIIDGVNGADIVFSMISYNNSEETLGVYTEPTLGQGEGITIKSSTETIVPFNNQNYKYYVVMESDVSSQSGTMLYIQDFVQCSGTIPTTSTSYNASEANTEIINAFCEESVISIGLLTELFANPGIFGEVPWRLPSKDELIQLQSALGGSGDLLDNYSYAQNLGHWSSSTGTSDTSKIWAVRLDTGQSTEVAYDAVGGYRVRFTKVVESQQDYSVGDLVSDFGGVVWKKESTTSPNKIVKIIKEDDLVNSNSNWSLTQNISPFTVGTAVEDLSESELGTWNLLLQAQDLSDGESNTQIINLAIGSGASDHAFELALDYTDGTYDDWYIPSVNEWYDINQGVGVQGVGVLNNLIDLTTSPPYFYTSTLSYGGALTLMSQSVFYPSYNSFQTDSFIGFNSVQNRRLKVIRSVETTDNVTLGQVYQGGRVFKIEPQIPAMVAPSIERWFNTTTLLSEAGFSTDDWGTLNNITFRVQFGNMNSGNKVVIQQNFSTPTDEIFWSPTGSVSDYPFPYQDEVTTSGTLHELVINQAEGTTNTDIQSGTFVGFKLSFENETPTQFLDIDIEHISISISRSYLEEEIVNNHREEVEIDLYKEFDFNTTYSVKDFEHLSKVASDYSKTIKVPATNTNKNVFGSLTNIKGGNNVDVASGSHVTVYKGGSTIFQGLAFVQKSIYNEYSKEEDLELVLRGGNASLFSLLKDIRLVDITRLNKLHEFSVGAAFGASLNYDSKIVYPLIDGGKLDVSESNQPVLLEKNITPAFSLWDVMVAIFDEVKYSVVSEFLDFDDEFSTGEFENDFQSEFKSFIGISSYPKINEKDIEKSRMMFSVSNNQAFYSRRAFQTNYGSTFVGNHDVNNAYLDKTPIIRRWGSQSGDDSRYLALDYRPIPFSNTVPLAEGSSASFNFESGLYSSNPTAGLTKKIGQVGNPQVPQNTGECPISWDSSVKGTSIQVHRTGFYNVDAVTTLSFFRDTWLSQGQGQIDPNHTSEQDGYIAGIKRHPKFTVALLSFDLGNSADEAAYFQSSRSLGELLFNSSTKYKEFDILTNKANELVSTSQIQYLEEGVLYYPVAIMADEIHEGMVSNQLDSLVNGWTSNPNTSGSLAEYIDENILITNGSIDYNARHFFILQDCSLTISLDKDPCPLQDYNAYYTRKPLITVNDLLPDITALDFVVEVSKIFNLIWTTNQKTKTATCEPFNDFYDFTLSNVVDWTEIAFVEEQKINSVLPKKMDYKFLEDSNDKSLAYFQQVGESSVKFGDVSLNLNPSSTQDSSLELKVFSTGKMNIASGMFNEAGTPSVNQNTGVTEFDWNPFSVKLITAYSEQNVPFYKENRSKPSYLNSFNLKLANYKGRLSFYDFLNTNGITDEFVSLPHKTFTQPLNNETSAQTSTSNSNYFCVAKTYDSSDVDAPTATFSNTKSFVGADGGLYNKYHQRQIEMLKFSDRLITAKVKLTPADINNLDFRKPIKIKDDYFIISKISNFDPSNEEPTKVELVLIHQRGTKEAL